MPRDCTASVTFSGFVCLTYRRSSGDMKSLTKRNLMVIVMENKNFILICINEFIKKSNRLRLILGLCVFAILLPACAMSRLTGDQEHVNMAKLERHNMHEEKSISISDDPWHVVKDGYDFRFTSAPLEPEWDEKAILELRITKIAENNTSPVTGVHVTCRASMPNDQLLMQGLTHNYKEHKIHWEMSPGVYVMHIQFGMGGDWEINYRIKMPGHDEFHVSFPLNVKRPENLNQEWENTQPAKPELEEN